MSKIVYDMQMMKVMSLFGSITRSKLKDCVAEESSYLFVVEPGEIGKAVGKKGANVKRLEKALGKKIKIVEFHTDPGVFFGRLVYPNKIKEHQLDGNILLITPPDTKTRGYLIGRNAQSLRHNESLLKRYFPIEEVKIV